MIDRRVQRAGMIHSGLFQPTTQIKIAIDRSYFHELSID